MNLDERRLGALRTAHEKLCIAQAGLDNRPLSDALSRALAEIERVGVLLYPVEWSKHREPTIDDPFGEDR